MKQLKPPKEGSHEGTFRFQLTNKLVEDEEGASAQSGAEVFQRVATLQRRMNPIVHQTARNEEFVALRSWLRLHQQQYVYTRVGAAPGEYPVHGFDEDDSLVQKLQDARPGTAGAARETRETEAQQPPLQFWRAEPKASWKTRMRCFRYLLDQVHASQGSRAAFEELNSDKLDWIYSKPAGDSESKSNDLTESSFNDVQSNQNQGKGAEKITKKGGLVVVVVKL